MAKNSNISWTNHSWNPVVGCRQISRGCDDCYAKRIAERFRGSKGFPNGFDITLKPDKLNDPIIWKKPSYIFVNSMSDLFVPGIPDYYLSQIWKVMLQADHHIYQILTKRPDRMERKINELGLQLEKHIWLGVSVEDQLFADSRIPVLLNLNSHMPWISAEPLLEHIDLTQYINELKWVVVGGESGAKRRYMDYNWARSIRDQCTQSDVVFYYKQGNSSRSGRDYLLDGKLYQDYPSYKVLDKND